METRLSPEDLVDEIYYILVNYNIPVDKSDTVEAIKSDIIANDLARLDSKDFGKFLDLEGYIKNKRFLEYYLDLKVRRRRNNEIRTI